MDKLAQLRSMTTNKVLIGVITSEGHRRIFFRIGKGINAGKEMELTYGQKLVGRRWVNGWFLAGTTKQYSVLAESLPL